MIFFCHFWPKIIFLNIFLPFSCLIKFFSHKDLGFILFFVLSLIYRRLVCRRFITTWCYLSSYSDVVYLCGDDLYRQDRFDQSNIKL